MEYRKQLWLLASVWWSYGGMYLLQKASWESRYSQIICVSIVLIHILLVLLCWIVFAHSTNNLAFLNTGCSCYNLLTLLLRTDCQTYDSQPDCCLNRYGNPVFIFCEHILIRAQPSCYFQADNQREISNNNSKQGACFSNCSTLNHGFPNPVLEYSCLIFLDSPAPNIPDSFIS